MPRSLSMQNLVVHGMQVNWWAMLDWVPVCVTEAKNITKSGSLRRDARNYAGRAIRMSPCLKEQYEKYLRRMRRPNHAIVVIARKLLVAVWQALTKEETDVHASEEDLAYKMLVLSWDLDESIRLGLTYKQFAKYALMRLGVEKDIRRFVRKNVPRRIAPMDEVLARMAELGLTEWMVRRISAWSAPLSRYPRACSHGSKDRVIVLEHGQHNDTDVRAGQIDLPCGFDAVHAWHLDMH